MKQECVQLFENHFTEEVEAFENIRPHGSSRRIVRLQGKFHKAIAVENSDVQENQTFIYFSKHFLQVGLSVPKIFAVSTSQTCYLQEDFGDMLLFDLLFSERTDADPFPKIVEDRYNEVLAILPRFQVLAGSTLDYSKCYKSSKFDASHMLSDMYSFRDQYLLATGEVFDNENLEKEFKKLSDYLAKVKSSYFMYRDFQSRNILIYNNQPCFIDYQGGCQGALQYDVASLLYQAQARIPQEARERLLKFYLEAVSGYVNISTDEFLKNFYAFVVLRIMQVLGTYGLRGLKERKQYFIDSIDFALSNSQMIYNKYGLPVKMPEFEMFIKRIRS